MLGSRAVAHRILYLIDSLGVGGAERGLCLTLRHLDHQRVKAEVAYLFEPSQLGAEVRATGVPLHRIGAGPGIAALASIRRVQELLRSGRFDAVHTQLLWASIVGRVAGRRASSTWGKAGEWSVLTLVGLLSRAQL